MPFVQIRSKFSRISFFLAEYNIFIIFIIVIYFGTSVRSANAQLPTNCPNKPNGDANCNGSVDLQDFEYWRREFIGELNSKNSDFDISGIVDLLDFEAWRRYITGSVTSPTPSNNPTAPFTPTIIISPTLPLPQANNFGEYNPNQIPIELQTFFTPRPDNGRGYGSLHILCKWPLGQKVTGIIKTNCRISLHNNPSTLRLLRFDLTPGEIIKKIELGNKSCPYEANQQAICAWNVPVELDTANWKKGWRHLRVRATLQTIAEEGYKTWTSGSELPFLISNSTSQQDENDKDDCKANCFLAASSFEGNNDDRNVLIKNIPPGKIRGNYIFLISAGKIENPPSRRLNVYLDKNYDIPPVSPWPQEVVNKGLLLLDLPDPDPKKIYQVQIDTMGLTNGWHSLSAGTIGTRPEKARCKYCDESPNYQSAVGKLWFYVEN